jgi:alkylation response protein AidB-like acyl-CoA dehydrogenase
MVWLAGDGAAIAGEGTDHRDLSVFRYQPDRDQIAIADDVTGSLKELLPLSRLHRHHWESAEIWSELDALGLFGISLPESVGGSGLGAVEEALIVIGLGQQLAAPAVLATLGAAHVAPQPVGSRRIAAGYRNGGRILAVEEPMADLVLVRGEGEAALYRLPMLARPLDDSLWLAALHELAEPGEAVAEIGDDLALRLRMLDAAVLAGIAQAAVDMAVDYAGFREQFGRPIGSFQAVKHHCANMILAARQARDQTTFAAMAIDTGRPDAVLQADCAFVAAASAALENAARNIQIPGGIGFSDEADPHLILKRARLYLALAGGVETAHQRIAGYQPIW